MKAVALAQGHLREKERELNHAIRVKAEISAALAKMKARDGVDAALKEAESKPEKEDGE
jgi:hypothetical protein